MTADPITPPGGVSQPALRVIVSCPGCRTRLAEVRDRFGAPVRFDCDGAGKAVRDPAGVWWAVNIAGQWRVTRPLPGEAPPVRGAGVRFTEHRCPRQVFDLDQVEGLLADAFTATPVPSPAAGAPRARREDSESFLRGRGVDGPECPERPGLDQRSPAGGLPCSAMCIQCGRVTARRNSAGRGWCAGEPPHPRLGLVP